MLAILMQITKYVLFCGALMAPHAAPAVVAPNPVAPTRVATSHVCPRAAAAAAAAAAEAAACAHAMKQSCGAASLASYVNETRKSRRG